MKRSIRLWLIRCKLWQNYNQFSGSIAIAESEYANCLKIHFSWCVSSYNEMIFLFQLTNICQIIDPMLRFRYSNSLSLDTHVSFDVICLCSSYKTSSKFSVHSSKGIVWSSFSCHDKISRKEKNLWIGWWGMQPISKGETIKIVGS